METSKKPVLKKQVKNKPLENPAKETNEINQDYYNLKIISNLILILIMLIILLFSIYLIYQYTPGKPEKLDINLQPLSESELEKTNQFYPNMKFNHNNISYYLDPLCSEEKKQRMLLGFEQLSLYVPEIIFHSASISPDIEVSCSKESKESINEDFFIAGEGGAKEIIKTGEYNVITSGIVLLFRETENIKKCDWPNIELHELMHVFGFEHSQDKNNLMYPYLESCNQRLDEQTISKLIQLYSEKNLPDLYFEEVNATKKGRYLDFDAVIKNSGTVDSKNFTLTILDNQEIVETKEIGSIEFGAGLILKIQNLKLLHKNPDEITFILNKDNKIKEKDVSNNILKIRLN